MVPQVQAAVRLARPWRFEAVIMAVLFEHEQLIEQVRRCLETVSAEKHLSDGNPPGGRCVPTGSSDSEAGYSTRRIKAGLSWPGLLTIRDTGYASSCRPVFRESTSRTSCTCVRAGSSQASSSALARITGMRWCSLAIKGSASVVVIVKVERSSPSGVA
jgi:hypothetical protein